MTNPADQNSPSGELPPGEEPSGRVRVRVRRRVNMRRLRQRRRLALAMLVIGVLILGCGAWLAFTALSAKSSLEAVRDGVRTLRTDIDAGNLAAARRTADSLRQHAADAHDATSGPVWAATAALPGAQPLRTVRQITTQVDILARDVLPPLISASEALDPATLRRSDGSIDIARIAKIAPVLDKATTRLAAAVDAVANEPADSGVGAVDDARSDLLGQLTGLYRTLRSADLASHITPAFLGADGVRRYFVAFQNNAEARGTGGLPGAFAILRADRGAVSFERFEPDDTLIGTSAKVDFGAGYAKLFANARTTSLYLNSNLSPHFPYAAQIWQSMWRNYSGQQLDGAVAIDPETLSYLLAATGPAKLADGTRVTASNVVDLTQRTVYSRFPKDQEARKDFLLDLARAVSRDIIESRANPAALVRAGAKAAGERRLLVYSNDADVQRYISQTALSGEIPQNDAPYAGFSVVNNGGNKLDYYLDRSITWTRTGCGDNRRVVASIRVTNNAPAKLPRYVTARSDLRDFEVRPGDQSLEISYYATPGSRLLGSRVDGRVEPVAAGNDLGHPVFTIDVEVPRGATRTFSLEMADPPSNEAPTVLRQPLVRPLDVRVVDRACR